MHHFMSTPRTSTKCHTLSTALSLFHLSFLSFCNSSHCFPSLIAPLDDGAKLVFAPSSLSSLSSLFPALFFLGRQTGHIPQGGPGALFWHVSALHPSLIPLFLLSSPQMSFYLHSLWVVVPSSLVPDFGTDHLSIYLSMGQRQKVNQRKVETERHRILERGQFRGLMAGDGCDFSQVPKGPKEKTALCSDNTALSGVLRVCVSFLLHCPLAWCLSTNTGLHYTFRWETQAWREKRTRGGEKYIQDI